MMDLDKLLPYSIITQTRSYVSEEVLVLGDVVEGSVQAWLLDFRNTEERPYSASVQTQGDEADVISSEAAAVVLKDYVSRLKVPSDGCPAGRLNSKTALAAPSPTSRVGIVPEGRSLMPWPLTAGCCGS